MRGMKLKQNWIGWFVAVALGMVVLAFLINRIAAEPAELRWRSAGRAALFFAGVVLLNYCARRAGNYFR